MIERLKTYDQDAIAVMWSESNNGYYPLFFDDGVVMANKYNDDQYFIDKNGKHKILVF